MRRFFNRLNTWPRVIVASLIIGSVFNAARGDYTVTQGLGTTIFAFVCFTSKVCPASTLVTSTGTEIMTSGSPGFVSVTNANANGQATMANSSPVVVASNQSAIPTSVASGGIASGALASGSVASGALASGSVSSGAFASGSIGSGALASGSVASGAFASGSFLNATAGDPCMFQAKTNVPISTASGTTALVTGVSAKRVYVCSMSLVAATAIAVSLSEGSGTTCGTSAQAAVLGVATNGTAANGISLAANGGLTLGNGGGTVAATATNANYLCLFQSGTAQLSGNLTYVQQ